MLEYGPPPRPGLRSVSLTADAPASPSVARARFARSLARTTRRLRAEVDPLPEPVEALVPIAEGEHPLDVTARLATYLAFVVRWLGRTDTTWRDALPLHNRFAPLLDHLEALPVALPPADPTLVEPVLHLYAPFISALEPARRATDGVVYTPAPVVDALVGQLDRQLRTTFGLSGGLLDPTPWAEVHPNTPGASPRRPFVCILDPAMGTGAFLLGIVRRARQLAADRDWAHVVENTLVPRMIGIERDPVACLLARLCLGLALEDTGLDPALLRRLPWQLECADTLAPPRDSQHKVLWSTPVTVVVGNPPYARTAADAPTGGWIRTGHPAWRDGTPPLDDYTAPVRHRGEGRHLKSVYNLYAYFWRWCTWRVFENNAGTGIVALVTAASFLRGAGFGGLRQHLRGCVDSIDIVDLEGDQRAPRPTDNVFGITVPVCLTTAWRAPGAPTRVRYARLTGSRSDKLAACAALARHDSLDWAAVPAEGPAPLVAPGPTTPDAWPRLVDLFPWQHSGLQYKRTWPIGVSPDVLQARWTALLHHPDRATALRTTRARPIDCTPKPVFGGPKPPALATLPPSAPPPPILQVAHRSFDRRWALVDPRLCDRIRPALWRAHGPGQLYLTSLLTGIIGDGPAATIAASVPDLHHFRGSYGGKDVVPLWRNAAGTRPNLTAGLLDRLGAVHGTPRTAEDLWAYVVAVLTQPAFQQRFAASLRQPGLPVPLTADAALFDQGIAHGRALTFHHTFGERLAPTPDTRLPSGSARVTRPIPPEPPLSWSHDPHLGLLHVGDGTLASVPTAVMHFTVSGLRVVRSWLDHRVGRGAGRTSSPLDHIRPERWTDALTTELLQLLAVLEWTLETAPDRAAWLARVVDGPLLQASDLPHPTPAARRPPAGA